MKTIVVSFFASLCLFGCASDDRSSTASNEVRASGDLAVDPVSGQDVRPDTGWKTQWKGRWYYFESAENQRRFETNPTAYVIDDSLTPERRKVYPHEVR
jgi:YHS domain-containing protein